MAYKTVLVHCNDKSRIARVLAPATQVAAGFQAHLIGLSVTPPVIIIPTGMPGAPDTMVIDEHCKAYRKDNPEMKAAFETAGRARNVASEWREVDAGEHERRRSRAAARARCRSRRRRADRYEVARLATTGYRRSPGARERSPGADHSERGTAARRGREGPGCVECAPRGGPRRVRCAAAPAAGKRGESDLGQPAVRGRARPGHSRRGHLHCARAPRRQVRSDPSRAAAHQRRPDPAHARPKIAARTCW